MRSLAPVGCAVLLLACSASKSSVFKGTTSADAASASSGAGGALTGSGGSTGTLLTVGSGGGGDCPLTCSADLQKVIDCKNVVVETCTGDKACLNGTCSGDPCGAATAQKSSYGCDYWAVKTPPTYSIGARACFAAYIVNTWSSPVKIKVSYGGQVIPSSGGFIKIPKGQGMSLSYSPYVEGTGVPVGEVAIVFLDQGTGGQNPCPSPVALAGEHSLAGTGRQSAFRIETDRPVTAYTLMPYGGAGSAITSATLLLPTSAWDKNYIAVNPYSKSYGDPSFVMLAYEDNTEVTLLPNVPIVGGGGINPSPANVPVKYTLKAGEYVQIAQATEITGSPVQSNKPIGAWGHSACINVPNGAVACDASHQQIPPVRALGHRYVGVRYRNRATANGEEAPPWRIVGAVDGTTLSWTPSAPPGAPSTIKLGEVKEFQSSGPFVVKSQDEKHPFYLAQYMTGCGHVGSSVSEGDPEWVNVVPVDQYLSRFVFFTDPTYSETNLVVVRRKSQATMQFEPVTLACAGPLTGWKPIGDYEYTRIDLVTGNFQNVGKCSNGRHEMTSNAAFGVTVWGWGQVGLGTHAVSYAYPAGASVQAINEVIVPPTPK